MIICIEVIDIWFVDLYKVVKVGGGLINDVYFVGLCGVLCCYYEVLGVLISMLLMVVLVNLWVEGDVVGGN